MNNIYRGPSIYASYKVSVHLAERFQRFLEIDQPETITAYGYSVSEEFVIGHFVYITCNRNVIDYIHFDPVITITF
jgi:hypothetical protein